MPAGNQGRHDSGVHSRIAWNSGITFEEGTSATWLHDLLKPHVSRLVVCDPRKNALLKDGNKNDRVDARKLAELLRTNKSGRYTTKSMGPAP
jgi:transposase